MTLGTLQVYILVEAPAGRDLFLGKFRGLEGGGYPVSYVSIIERHSMPAKPSSLKLTRIKAGLLQRQLARRLGVTHAAISYWESGAMAISPAMRKKFIAACKRHGA